MNLLRLLKSRRALTLCFVLLSIFVFAGSASAETETRICDTGQVIWDNGNFVGCIFNTWGSYQASLCNGAVYLPPGTGGTCHVCVTSGYVSTVNDPNQWSNLAIGTTWANSTTADFTCRGTTGCVAPVDEGADLDSNRSNGLLDDTFQAVMFYDGNSAQNVELRFQYLDVNGQVCWQTLDQVQPFTSQVVTRQLDLQGAQLTGNIEVAGVSGNGGIDGLAFGFFWKDDNGRYHILKSNQASPTFLQDFVGAWPIAMGEGTFAARTPQITDGNARAQARSTINGTAMLNNGSYFFTIY